MKCQNADKVQPLTQIFKPKCIVSVVFCFSNNLKLHNYDTVTMTPQLASNTCVSLHKDSH